MKFSELFDFQIEEDDNWFDPILTLDTKLFIDPFLVYQDEDGAFIGSHDEVISFFNIVFSLIAKSGGNQDSFTWKRAESLLLFPEAYEFCLGYSGKGTQGAGAGKGFAKVIAAALWEAIEAGVQEITHFEEIGILREGIGADIISDITATLLKHRFASYTAAICHKYKVNTASRRYRRGIFSEKHERWNPVEFELPLNPYNDKPILLAPQRYLRELPTINSGEFWDFCYDNENELLRQEFGLDITRHIDKETIVKFARRHPEIRQQFISASEQVEADPYDFERDPKGVHRWYDDSQNYCTTNPLELAVNSEAEFLNSINGILLEFQNFIENNSGWKLLWNDNDRSRSEEASQLLFLGIVKHYCKANNIDISREANIGRGPVDFKVSQGYELRALLELKLAKNTRFWHGFSKQLPKYQEAEDIDLGYFIVIAYTDNDMKKLSQIQERVEEVNSATDYTITAIVIDARKNPLSASKL